MVATLPTPRPAASNVAVAAAVAVYLRADWRRRRAAVIGLVLLAGLAGGFVLTAAAGARRTATSLDRMVEETKAGELVIDVGKLEPDVVDRIAQLPMIEESGLASIVFAVIDGVDADLGLWIPRDGNAGVTVERDRLLRGRRPAPQRGNEVIVNETAAALISVDVGDKFTISTLTTEQVDRERYFPPEGPQLRVTVVGVTRGAGDLIDRGEGQILASPAAWKTVEGKADIFTSFLAARLAPGATADQLDEAAMAVAPRGAEYGSIAFDVRAKPAHDAIAALAGGLTVFALIAGVVAIAAVGQAIGRHLSTAGADQQVLAALGLSPRSRRAAMLLAVAPIAAGGALVAFVAAVLASPLMPIGLARRAEPDPGISIDVVVLVLGALAVGLVVLGAAAVTARWLTRTRPEAQPARTASTKLGATLRSQAGPAAAVGMSLALDRRPPALPVRTALAGVTTAVLGVVGVLTFSASLDDLVTTPDRWGYPWDLSMNFTSANVAAGAAALVDDERLAALARWDAGFTYVNGEGTRAFGLTPLRGHVGFSLRSGRQPVTEEEVVVGPVTADHLGIAVGETVRVTKGEGSEASTVRVVGLGLFPEIDEGNFTDAVGFYGGAFERSATIPDFFEASQVVVRFPPGADSQALIASLSEEYPESIAPETIPSPPGSVGNLAGLRTLPKWLAAFVAALGLASLLHTLVTTLRRRRRSLATLRGMGFTKGQTIGSVVWQAVSIGAAGLVAGIPLGLIAGRAAWWAVTDPIGVATTATRPWLGVVAVGAGALAGAVLLAAPLAAASTRRSPAAGLRAE